MQNCIINQVDVWENTHAILSTFLFVFFLNGTAAASGGMVEPKMIHCSSPKNMIDHLNIKMVSIFRILALDFPSRFRDQDHP